MARPLASLWSSWRLDLLLHDNLARVARPALLPHLRAVDAAQRADIPHTLALERQGVDAARVDAVLATHAWRAAEAGWPGALPVPGAARPAPAPGDPGVLDLYVEALVDARCLILALLQGAEPVSALAVAYAAWRRSLLTRPPERPGPTNAEVGAMWELAAGESNWNLRAALLHLAVCRLERGGALAGLLARLVMNTVRAAAGHAWLSIPASERRAYVRVTGTAVSSGDAEPFGTFLAALEPDDP